MQDAIDVEEQLVHLAWAENIILQAPVNWMTIPWSFKKYMDEVFSAGMQGVLCNFDGRTSKQPKKNYGTGGTKGNAKYMLSLTFNAPKKPLRMTMSIYFKGKALMI